MLVHDRDDMVVKAMSWALRALSAKNPCAVEVFLADHVVPSFWIQCEAAAGASSFTTGSPETFVARARIPRQ
jgi:hypothetical protein